MLREGPAITRRQEPHTSYCKLLIHRSPPWTVNEKMFACRMRAQINGTSVGFTPRATDVKNILCGDLNSHPC